jgi:hypothetical protein
MGILLTLCAASFLLTVFFLRRTLACTRRRRVVRAGASGMTCMLSAAMLSGLLVLTVSYLGYQRLTYEQVVATLQFSRIAPYEYRARMMVDGEADRFFVLSGNEWQIDARMVSWQPPATILGLDPIYRLERLSGRYADVDDERERPRSAHALSDQPLLDVWSVAKRVPVLMPGVDAYYGTATYVPMADGALYEVSLSRDALIARPANGAAEDALGNWQ